MFPRPDKVRLDELIDRSPGSQLIGYTFESKELRFQLFHEGLGSLLGFHIPTDTVHGRSVRADPRRSICRIALFELERLLFVKDGRYLPPTEHSQFLEHARDRVTLAYGRRASELRWLFVLKGEYPLLACLLRDPADVRWAHE